MTIETFVATFNANNDKEAVCRERVIKKYVPFLTKVAECTRIVNATMMEPDADGNMVYKQKTPMRFLIFSMTLVRLYTDIDFEDESIVESFDDLDEIGAMEYIHAAISPREVKEFNTLLSMTIDDYMENRRTLLSYFDNALNPKEK